MLASVVMAAGLWWSSQHWSWVELWQQPLLRAGLMALVLLGALGVYLTLLVLMKFPLRSIIKA